MRAHSLLSYYLYGRYITLTTSFLPFGLIVSSIRRIFCRRITAQKVLFSRQTVFLNSRSNSRVATHIFYCLSTQKPVVESRTQGSRPRPRTQKNFGAKAKDRSSRGQGLRTQAQVFSKKRRLSKNFFKQSQKKSLQKFFSGEKRSSNFFFRQFPLEENQKRSSQIFCKVSGAFQQNFNGSKNCAVLEPRTRQFSMT